MSDAKVLIVEDEGIETMDIQQRLVSLGYAAPDIVFTGEEAIQKAEETRPDLVLMDIMLPGEIDGVTAAEQIRARFDIPVIYLTAYADEATLQRAKITEPYGYIVKPFKERELHITIDMALYKHRIERKLKESEKWLSTTLRSIGDAVIATDKRGRITFMNPVAENLTGWRLEECLNKKLTEVFKIINRDTRQPIENPVTKVILEGNIVGLANHTRLIARDGAEIPIDDSAAPIRDDKGNIIGIILVFRDITEREKAEEALTRAKGELETRVLERTAELEAEIGERKRAQKEMQVRANQQTVVAQIGQRALGGSNLGELFHETVKEVAQTLNVEYCKVLELLPGEKELLLRAGVGWKEGLAGHATVGTGIDSQAGYTLLSDKPVIVEDLRTEKRFSGPPLLHEHGVVSGMSVIIQGRDRPFGVLGAHTTRRLKFTEDDIHFLQAIANVLAATIERKRAEEQLRESGRKLRHLSSELMTAQETERKRIAGELHDSVAASLGAIIFSIEKILGQGEQDESTQLGLRELILRVQHVNEETRRIMSDLRPSLLDDLGIVPAIQWFCREFQKTYSSISIERLIDMEETHIPDPLRTPIFRICQEALNNVAKHSKASMVNLCLREGNSRIELTIQDNGQGFDLETVRRGLGLSTMRERTELSGGACIIKSVKGAGTTIRCAWPLT